MDQDPESDGRKLVISRAIEAVLDRHGVPERQRLNTLEATTGLSYQQVRRRMTGETSWNVDEIKRLASHFGEPLFKLLGSLVDDAGQPATLRAGVVDLSCSIWPGQVAQPSARLGPLLALPGEAANGQWLVVPAGEVGARAAHEIRRLIFEAPQPKRIAVVDDDDDLAGTIVQFMRNKGLEAIPYSSVGRLMTALETLRFDGFILDWLLSDRNVREVLPAIRERSPAGPIIILTGQIQTGQAREDELAAAIAKFRAQLYEKPTRMLSLFNALMLGLEGTPRAPPI